MRKTLGVSLLVLLLSGSAVAGEIPNDTPAPPPPPQINVVQEPTDDATLNGDTQSPGASDILTQTVLDLLTFLPSLL
jgi:hypothetical protein